jgi:hypothetical protein
MKVKIRFENGPRISRVTGKNRNLALAAATLISPATLIAFVLAFWRMSSDIGVTAAFPITDGLLSHWQVWLAIALCAQFTVILLNRYGRQGTFRDSNEKSVIDRAA